MALGTFGIVTPQTTLATEQINVLDAYVRAVYLEETPLLTRLPRLYVGSEPYQTVTYQVRPRVYTLASALLAGDAALVLVDASTLMIGDVLEILNTAGTAVERVEVTADPTGGPPATTVAITRAHEGTTAVANTAVGNLGVTLIGNSRTGAEISQNGFRDIRVDIPNWTQTFQYPVQVGGKVQSFNTIALPPGFNSVFNLDQQTKLTEMVRDIDYSMTYGVGEAGSAIAPGRAKMRGIRTWIKVYAAANFKTTGGASYTPVSMVNDVLLKCIQGGGKPDVLLVPPDFMLATATWQYPLQRVVDEQASKALGQTVEDIWVTFLPQPIRIWPSYQMTNGTICALTSQDCRIRYNRQEYWQPRGIRGDAVEGDFIGDFSFEVGHPTWHAWVEGITSYAKAP